MCTRCGCATRWASSSNSRYVRSRATPSTEAVRRVASALPRAYEVEVRGRWRFRVGQIVYAAFSRDETIMGFAFPKEEREALVASEPDKFLLPGPSDMRYRWVCVRLDVIDVDAAGSDVRRDEDVDLALRQPLEVAGALGLVEVTVE